jgi:threonine dehydratase
VTLLEHGDDFQAAREHAIGLAAEQACTWVPSFHRNLVKGVMTAWVGIFRELPARRGGRRCCSCRSARGPGFCAAAAARAHTGAGTRLIGVVSAHATCYLDSYRAGKVVEAPVTTLLADGMACRLPDQEALDVLLREAEDVVAVSDDEVAEAMRILFADTHNVAEGAGAAGAGRLRCSNASAARASRSACRSPAATSTPKCLPKCLSRR